ncbi:hypothetical protein [uncultured Bacteroides sp.]|nr:hypothetical protein [uncultured Bacteroides sp.]
MKNEKRRIAMRKDIIIESPPCYLGGRSREGRFSFTDDDRNLDDDWNSFT